MSLVFSSDKDGTALCWIRDCGPPEKGTKRARNVPLMVSMKPG
jgi:hypothetical protein